MNGVFAEGIWYIVCSGEKKESVYGFWKVCEEPCEIYSNTDITGWKTTLEYFEGQTPHEQRTDWVMHAYSITRKELCGYDQTKVPKNQQLSGVCILFLGLLFTLKLAYRLICLLGSALCRIPDCCAEPSSAVGTVPKVRHNPKIAKL